MAIVIGIAMHSNILTTLSSFKLISPSEDSWRFSGIIIKAREIMILGGNRKFLVVVFSLAQASNSLITQLPQAVLQLFNLFITCSSKYNKEFLSINYIIILYVE